MAKYVKVCPRCGRANDEFGEVCEADGEFLGMVPATLAAAHESAPAESPGEAPSAAAAPAPEAQPAPTPVLYLDAGAGGACFEIRDGWVVGQAHFTSTAEVQLTNLPGLQYVHRRHCLFEYSDDGWHVMAIAQPAYTNPTLVNDQTVRPGERVAVHNGDRVTLSATTFSVRTFQL